MDKQTRDEFTEIWKRIFANDAQIERLRQKTLDQEVLLQQLNIRCGG